MRKTWIAAVAALAVLVVGIAIPSTGRRLLERPRTGRTPQATPLAEWPAAAPALWPEEKPWKPNPPVPKKPEWAERLCPDVETRAEEEWPIGLRDWRSRIDEMVAWDTAPRVYTVGLRPTATVGDQHRVLAKMGMNQWSKCCGFGARASAFTVLVSVEEGREPRAVLAALIDDLVVDFVCPGPVGLPSTIAAPSEPAGNVDPKWITEQNWRSRIDELATWEIESDAYEIDFRRGTTDEDRRRVYRKMGVLRVEADCGVFEGNDDGTDGAGYLLFVRSGSDVRTTLNSVVDDPAVHVVYPHVGIRLDEMPDDPEFPRNSAFHNAGQTGGLPGADIDAPEAWDIWNAPFMRECVAVLDTGIDMTHPDLRGSRWMNFRELNGLPGVDDDGNGEKDDIYGYDFIDNDGDPSDEDGHGTMVAGVLAAASDRWGTAGLCREVVILPIRMTGEGQVLGPSKIVRAIEYAVRCGADVIQCSWYLPQTFSELRGAIEYANRMGVLVVCTAGNFPIDVDQSTHFPASVSLPNVVVVTGTDQWDRFIPSFGYGRERVLLAAPGSEVLTTMMGNKIGHAGGTSIAAPQVSGAAALAIGYWKFMNYADTRPTLDVLVSALTRGVDRLPTLEGKCRTGGRLNLAKVLGAIYEQDRHAMVGWTYRGGRYLSGVQVTLSSGRTTASDQFGSWAFHSLRDGLHGHAVATGLLVLAAVPERDDAGPRRARPELLRDADRAARDLRRRAERRPARRGRHGDDLGRGL